MEAFLRRLLDSVFPPRDTTLIVRDMHENAVLKLLSPTLVGVTNPATVALLPFVRSGVRALVHEAKYRDNSRAQTILAAVLAEYLSEIDTDAFGNTVLIPLPLSKGRLRERGFNQCERIASLALTNTPHACRLDASLLTRTRNTAQQAQLPHNARKENVRGAFSAPQALDADVTYLILDDVVTTGATMQAAIDALTAAGARRVIPLALSY